MFEGQGGTCCLCTLFFLDPYLFFKISRPDIIGSVSNVM